MKSALAVATLASFATNCAAVGVVGCATGFAAGTTGGGSATPQYPASVTQLTAWLTDSTARVIVLDKEFNFIGTEGSITEAGCRPASNTCPGNGGQDAINHASWCTNGNAGSGAVPIPVTYDKAGVSGIKMGSNKSLIGIGAEGVMRGKGLQIANGACNVIIQNIHITELNPQYIWGGDAITLAGSDQVWIDHVKVSLIGRQMFVAGEAASGKVTLSNSEFDGSTSWSATCDGHHYWTIYLTGCLDYITMANNYIHHSSGRSPKIGGNTLLHAVNNYWFNNTGHAFALGSSGSHVVAEGNVFQNVLTPLLSNIGKLFTAAGSLTSCKRYLGHNCVVNTFAGSGPFPGSDTSFFSEFNGYNVSGAATDSVNVTMTAGVGKI